MTDQIRQFARTSVLNRLVLLIALIIAGVSLASFIGFALAELLFGVPLLSEPSLMDDPSGAEMIPVLRMLQTLQAFGMLVVPSLAYIHLTAERQEVQQMLKWPSRQGILIAIALFMVAFPFINFIASWNAAIELPGTMGDWMEAKEAQAALLTEQFLDMPHLGLLAFNLLMMAVLPALGEELIFRGILQRGVCRMSGSTHLAVWIAAILFSAVHLQFLGFVPRLLMGVAMGYLFAWSGNLWYPVIAHFTNNAMAVILAFSSQHGLIRTQVEDAGTDQGSLAAFSLAFVLILLYLFERMQRTRYD